MIKIKDILAMIPAIRAIISGKVKPSDIHKLASGDYHVKYLPGKKPIEQVKHVRPANHAPDVPVFNPLREPVQYVGSSRVFNQAWIARISYKRLESL